MFTGIVETMGIIDSVTTRAGAKIAKILYPQEMGEPGIGESIAINGVCLTVIAPAKDGFDVEISPETLKRSNLHELKKGDYVNIERALRIGGRLGGHIVNGHVDGIGILASRRKLGESEVFEIRADDTIMKYIVFKGSVAINGISLTVSNVLRKSFEVTILPYTVDKTNLQFAKQGDTVNIEVDIIGKYVEKLLKRGDDARLMELLGNSGFLKEE